MSKIIYIFWIISTIVNVTHAQYVPADTAQIKSFLFQTDTLFEQGKYDAAFAKADTAQRIIEQIFGKTSLKLARPLNKKGEISFWSQKHDKVVAYAQQVLALPFQSVPLSANDSLECVIAYYQLTVNPLIGKDYEEKALEYARQGLNWLPATADSMLFSPASLAASLWLSTGRIHADRGDYDTAIIHLQEAIKFNLSTQPIAYSNLVECTMSLGEVYDRTEQDYKARQYYHQALLYHQKLDSSFHQLLKLANIYTNIGNAYSNSSASLYYYEKALEIATTLSKSVGAKDARLAGFLHNIGEAYRQRGAYEKAFPYLQQSFELERQYFKHIPLRTHMILGLYYFDTKQYEQSSAFFQKVLAVTNQTPKHRAKALGHLADVRIKQGAYASADSLLKEALTILNFDKGLTEIPIIELEYLKGTLAKQASFKRLCYELTHEIQYLHQSRQTYQAVFATFDHQKRWVTTPNDKSQLQKNIFNKFEGAIKTHFLFQETIENKKAFDYSEQSKANLLQAQLKESAALHYARIPDTLLHKEHQLRIKMAWYEKLRQMRVNERKIHTDSFALQLTDKLVDLQQQYDELKQLFEQKYPTYYRLKYDTKTIDVSTLQNNILNKDQTLLSYFVGDSSIFAFVVRRDTFAVFDFKKNFPLESWVQQLRDGLYGYHTAKTKSDDLYEAKADSFSKASYQLYSKIFKPVSHLLTKDLVIIPDGVLGYVPFDVLLSELPQSATDFKTHAYLCHQYQVSYNYSATLWQEMLQKKHLNPPTKKFIGFAPYYDGDTTVLAARFPEDSLMRKNLDSLKYSGEEVFKIQKMMHGEALLNHQATKKSFEDTVSHYRIVHLATHGKANDKAGDYCFLAFSEQKDSIDNELLYVRDIYNLTLNADLVVLSACETGIGELKRGEGIVSLARAFTYSGAKSIVTTLWSINDKSTMQIMELFYRELKHGKPKDYALWKSKKKYLETASSKKAHPFYWSAFIPIGDMKPID